MKFSSCHIVGAGGTGTILMEPLIRMLAYHPNGTKNIYVYDGDEYEDGNSTRQLFDPRYCGVNKATAAAERYSSLCDITAVPEYLRRYDFTPRLTFSSIKHGHEPLLVVLAVDRESVRHELIKDLDDLDLNHDFVCVLPGNEYNTASCVWYSRVNNKVKPVHPFDVVTNYAAPTDQPPGSCGEEAVSSPQLINANFASALITNEVVYALLEGNPLPFRINYDSTKLSMTTEGKFLPTTPRMNIKGTLTARSAVSAKAEVA